jgi:glycolate oxidase FAD binding subunit
MAEQRSARDAKDVEDALAWANANSKRIALCGADTKAAVGCPFEADMALSLAGLAGVVDYEPSELVLTARPGTPLADIQGLLASRGQHFAFEPMDYAPLLGLEPGRATLGGTVGAGVCGPRRIKAGGTRDHMLGFAGVSGRGEAFKGGGKVVKNVTGYDMAKLMTGSWGTLVALTEITLKVLPRPRASATLLFSTGPDDHAVKAMSAALSARGDITAAAHLPASVAARSPLAADRAVTVIRIEGVAPSIAPSAAAVRAEVKAARDMGQLGQAASEALWAWIRDVQAFSGPRDARQVWRVSVAPGAGPTVVGSARGEVEVEAMYDWGGGLLWLACEDTAEAGAKVRRWTSVAGGHATLVRASDATRRALGAFQPEPAALAALSRRVKASFDPNGVLNPGRMWPLAMTGA